MRIEIKFDLKKNHLITVIFILNPKFFSLNLFHENSFIPWKADIEKTLSGFIFIGD